MSKEFLTSARTTILGIILLVQVLATALYHQLDGVAETVPDWNEVISMVIVVGGLIFARDNNVSDQEAGVRPEP